MREREGGEGKGAEEVEVEKIEMRERDRERERALIYAFITPSYRPQYYKLLDQCTAQIVLHKSGVDPDFHYTKKFNVDVDNLIGTRMW